MRTLPAPRHRPKPSLSAAAALAYVTLVVYASLYPFGPWQWPPGATWEQLLLPWPRWVDPFDTWINLAGYLPLGLLMAWVVLRRGGRVGWALAVALIVGAALSFSMEMLQQFLRPRVPSARDWAINTAGVAWGAAVGVLVHRLGWLDRWRRWRDGWFPDGSAGAQALLLLWPLALLVPTAVPFGLGHLWPALQPWMDEVLADSPWAVEAAASPMPALGALSETGAVALGVLGPVLLAYAVSPPGWRRLGLLATVALGALSAMVMSTALNFGPMHAFTWLSPTTGAGLAAAAAAGVAAAGLGRRLCTLLALMALAAGVVLVAQAPADAYYALRLQAWEQGRFVRFHGVVQWMAWAWPYLAMAWLLAHRPQRAAG